MEENTQDVSAQEQLDSGSGSGFDRRAFLRRAGQAGMALAAVGIVRYPAGMPRRAPQSSAKSITVGLQDLYHSFMKPYLVEFKHKTGISVSLGSMPTSGGDMLALLSPQYAAGKAPFDVHITADEFLPGFIRAGWVAPLDEVFNPMKRDYPASVTSVMNEWMAYKGRTYAIPYGYNNGFTFQRHDVLHTLGVASIASWDQALALGAMAKKQKMWIFADSVSQPDVAYVFISNLAAQAGENVFDLGPGTMQAFEYVKQLTDKGYFPKVALNWTYDQQNAAYINNEIVSMRQWAFFYDVARAAKSWFQPAKAVITLPAKGPASRATWASCQGWMIPKFTSKQSAATQFVQFVTSPSVAARLAVANSGFVVPRVSTLKAMGNTGIIPALKMYEAAGVLVPRPFHLQTESAQHYIDVAISSYLSGQQTLSQAISAAKAGLKTIQ